MRRDLVIAGIMGALFVWTRFYLFGSRRVTVTPEMYHRPLFIESFALLGKSVPEGWSLPSAVPGGTKNPQSFKPAEELPRFPQAPLPEQDRIARVHVVSYVDANGGHCDIVTASYGKTSADRAPPRSLVDRASQPIDPALHVEDHYVTWINAANPQSMHVFQEALAVQLAQAHKSRDWLEKLIVLTKAYLQFFMDLLVGAFGFVLALFFLKYFLITRRVEGKV